MTMYNITPFVRWPAFLVTIFTCSVIPNVLLPSALGVVVAVGLGVPLGLAIMLLLEGDRLWLASTRSGRLPYELVVKPRGYHERIGIKNSPTNDEKKTNCDGCDDTFHPAEDHFESDYTHYCPDCSKIGETVMKNYQQWFDTTEDIRQGE